MDEVARSRGMLRPDGLASSFMASPLRVYAIAIVAVAADRAGPPRPLPRPRQRPRPGAFSSRRPARQRLRRPLAGDRGHRPQSGHRHGPCRRFGRQRRRTSSMPPFSPPSASPLSWFGERLKRSRLQSANRQRELQAREAHLQSILDTVPDAMIVIDEHGDHAVVQQRRRAPVRVQRRRKPSARTSRC